MIVDSLEQTWNQILDFMSKLVIPDWNALIALIPLGLLLFVVGPLVSILALVWFIHFLFKPRTHVSFDEGPRPAALDAAGQPLFPRGEPFSLQSGLIYPPGRVEGDDGEPLLVICPKCELGRAAEIDTCGNCGLVLRVIPRARALRPSGPPPGGAAAA